jgi:hypothetical protein
VRREYGTQHGRNDFREVGETLLPLCGYWMEKDETSTYIATVFTKLRQRCFFLKAYEFYL